MRILDHNGDELREDRLDFAKADGERVSLVRKLGAGTPK